MLVMVVEKLQKTGNYYSIYDKILQDLDKKLEEIDDR